MLSLLRTLFAVAALTCLAGTGGAEAAQDQQHYRRAISDNSTSPYFVLVTIVDDTTGKAVTGCVSANLLKGAIFLELGGTWGQADSDLMRRADETALKSIDHKFHFSKEAALANIPLRYTEADLADAEKIVQSIGVKALELPAADNAWRSMGRLQWSAALACAIIEQGASARQADATGQFYAEP